MTSWYIANRELSGTSDAEDWRQSFVDVESMLDKLFEECIETKAVAAYVEMWSDSGCFIGYPADPPLEGVLAERTTVFTIQLRLEFWRERWCEIATRWPGSEERYLQLLSEATSTIREALALSIVAAKLKATCPSFCVYVFEYEGTEGVTKLGLDGNPR